MNFGKLAKIAEYNILTQSGIAVTPDQLGLKATDLSGSIPGISSITGGTSSFNNVLSNMQMPTPPTPPADPTDAAAEAKYNQELLAYNQQIYTQNQQMMQQMMRQMSQMQFSSMQASNNSSSSSSTSNSVDGISMDSSPDI